MLRTLRFLCIILLTVGGISFSTAVHASSSKLVIADGGAGGYLLPNTLSSLAMAVVMEADTIKMDLLLTKDGQPVVLSSPILDKVSNVADIFPEKIGKDNNFHVSDFTVQELRQLSLTDNSKRFPAALSLTLGIPTFAEQLAMVRALEISLQRSIPIAIEPKQIWLHRNNRQDLVLAVLRVLKEYNYTQAGDSVTLLSYDADELKRLHTELLPRMQMNIALIQMIEGNDGQENMITEWGELVGYNYDWMFSKSGLRSISRYAAGVALPKFMLADTSGRLLLPDFVDDSHQLGMTLYTFPVNKNDPLSLPFVNSFAEELEFFFFTADVDGILTGYCRDAVDFLTTRTIPQESPPLENALTPPKQLTLDPLQLTRPASTGSKE